MMQLGIFAKTFAGDDPGGVLRAARAAGYATVQYNMACSGLPSMPDAIPDAVPAAIRAAASAAGVGIAALSATYNMIHPDPALRRRGHDRLRVLAAAAPAMGTRLLTLCTGTRDAHDQWRAHPENGSPEAWRDLLDGMALAVAIAEAHDVDLGIEPELANVVDSAARARALIDAMGSPRLKIVLDPANLFETAPLARQRAIVAEAVTMLGDRIVMAHAKDRDAAGGFATAGRGVVDFDHYLRCLADIGFDGPLVAHGLDAAEASDVAAFLGARLAALP